MNSYFEDENGNKSSIRLQMFYTMFFAFIVIGFQVFTNTVDLTLSVVLLSAAFVPKQVQKFSENIKNKDIN